MTTVQLYREMDTWDNSDLDDRESTQTCSAVLDETVPVCSVGCDLRDSVDSFSTRHKLSECITSYFEGSSLSQTPADSPERNASGLCDVIRKRTPIPSDGGVMSLQGWCEVG